MKQLLQAIIALVTVILFISRQKCTFAAVYPVKKRSIHGLPGYCGDCGMASSSFVSSDCQICRGSLCVCDNDLSKPKYKKDPRIKVDNEDIDGLPVVN